MSTQLSRWLGPLLATGMVAACVAQGGQSPSPGEGGGPGQAGASELGGAGGQNGSGQGGQGEPGEGGAAGADPGSGGVPQPDAGSPDLGAGGATAPDAMATDGARADAPTAVACPNARLCDDFESYGASRTLSQGGWRVEGTGIRPDTTRAYSGTTSVLIESRQARYTRHYLARTGAPVFPLPGNVMWGRMMVWLEAAPSGDVHWTNIQGEGPVTANGRTFRAMYRYGGMLQKRLMANYETSGISTDCWKHSQRRIPEGQWACFEWQFEGPTDTMRFWLDGQALPDLTVVGRGSGCIGNDNQGNWTAPTFDTIRLGWEHYQNSGPHRMWVDDVAVGTERIGCPPRRE